MPSRRWRARSSCPSLTAAHTNTPPTKINGGRTRTSARTTATVASIRSGVPAEARSHAGKVLTIRFTSFNPLFTSLGFHERSDGVPPDRDRSGKGGGRRPAPRAVRLPRPRLEKRPVAGRLPRGFDRVRGGRRGAAL